MYAGKRIFKPLLLSLLRQFTVRAFIPQADCVITERIEAQLFTVLRRTAKLLNSYNIRILQAGIHTGFPEFIHPECRLISAVIHINHRTSIGNLQPEALFQQSNILLQFRPFQRRNIPHGSHLHIIPILTGGMKLPGRIHTGSVCVPAIHKIVNTGFLGIEHFLIKNLLCVIRKRNFCGTFYNTEIRHTEMILRRR